MDGPPLEGSFEEYQEVVREWRRNRALTSGRAWRGDPNVYEAEPGERVRIAREPGARFVFVKYHRDNGGDFAIVRGGLSGHRLERCFTVDRVQPFVNGKRTRVVRSDQTDSELRKDDDDDDDT